MPLSKQLITETVVRNVAKAYDEIHKLGVLHGDVRKENILVRQDESVVIIDFDRTEINNVSNELIQMEDADVEALLFSL